MASKARKVMGTQCESSERNSSENEIEKGTRNTQTSLSSNSSDVDTRIDVFTPKQQKSIIHRVDRRLVLTLGAIYMVSLIDRTNLGLALVAGMQTDLKLVDERYSVLVLIYFPTYVMFQWPASIICRKIGPRYFLPLICVAWGAATIGCGFVHSYQAMLPIRVIIGIFEAGFFPGCAHLLSCWYPRYDLHKRYAVLWSFGSMSSAFSGLLAFGFSKMAGLGSGHNLGQWIVPTGLNPNVTPHELPGIAGWRWIFIMQGALTCLIGLITFFTIVDFPEVAKSTIGTFLTEKERVFMMARVEKDRDDVITEDFSMAKYLRYATDIKVYGFASLLGLATISSYAFAYFLPVILRNGMGFSVGKSQCLIAPPYVLAAFVMYIVGWYSDKIRVRSPFIIVNAILTIVGVCLLGLTKPVGLRYFGVFLAISAAYANLPAILTWQANNIRGQWKRAFCSASIVGLGAVGGIIGSTVFRTQDAPTYHPGIYTCILANALLVVLASFMAWSFDRANRRAAAGGTIIEGLEGFRYTL